MDCFFVITGCSGGGKSSLLAELARRGYAVVLEPGRRIVEEELTRSGVALPWVDLAAFARRATALALADLRDAKAIAGPIFFDRGLIDAAAALQHATGEPIDGNMHELRQYSRYVFLAPPWPDIYVGDPQRRHDFAAAAAEYGRLEQAYSTLGYALIVLPKISIEARADFVIERLTAFRSGREATVDRVEGAITNAASEPAR